MKKIGFLILLLVNVSFVFAQKTITIPDHSRVRHFVSVLNEQLQNYHLDDIRLSGDSVSGNYLIYTTGKHPVSKDFKLSQKELLQLADSVHFNELWNLKNDRVRGIDGEWVYLELATKNRYKVLAFWSPQMNRNEDCKTVSDLLGLIRRNIQSDQLHLIFFNSLAPGNYVVENSVVHVDRFLPVSDNQTDFYREMEKKIREELKVNDQTDHTLFPYVIIDNKPAFLADLNQYRLKQIKRAQVLEPSAKTTALYGKKASNGLIIVSLK